MNTNPIEFCRDPLTNEYWVDGLESASLEDIDAAAEPVRQNVPEFRSVLAAALEKEADDRSRFIAAMAFNGMRESKAVQDDRRKMKHCRDWATVLRESARR